MQSYESFINKSIADKLSSWLNRRQLLAKLPRGRGVVVDLGSGMEARNILPLRRAFRLCVATDYDVSPLLPSSGVAAVRSDILSFVTALPNNTIDMFLLISVLEHVQEESLLLQSIYSALKPDGYLAINVPTWRARPILEWMAFRTSLTSRFSINDHKRYYTPEQLWQSLRNASFVPENIEVRTHKIGMSVYAVAKK